MSRFYHVHRHRSVSGSILAYNPIIANDNTSIGWIDAYSVLEHARSIHHSNSDTRDRKRAELCLATFVFVFLSIYKRWTTFKSKTQCSCTVVQFFLVFFKTLKAEVSFIFSTRLSKSHFWCWTNFHRCKEAIQMWRHVHCNCCNWSRQLDLLGRHTKSKSRPPKTETKHTHTHIKNESSQMAAMIW